MTEIKLIDKSKAWAELTAPMSMTRQKAAKPIGDLFNLVPNGLDSQAIIPGHINCAEAIRLLNARCKANPQDPRSEAVCLSDLRKMIERGVISEEELNGGGGVTLDGRSENPLHLAVLDALVYDMTGKHMVTGVIQLGDLTVSADNNGARILGKASRGL